VLGVDVAPRLAGGLLEAKLLRRGVARARELGARVAHLCLGSPSPRRALAEKEGFALARVYWDLEWLRPSTQGRCDQLPPAGPLPAGYFLRRFQPGDAPLLTQVQNAAFGDEWGFCPNTVAQIEYRTAMSNTCHDGIWLLCDAAAPGKAAGYCWTFLGPVDGGIRGVIGMIGVAPEHRGRGLSRALLHAGMGSLLDAGVDHIGLHVDRSNAAALALYQAAGFQKTGELDWFEAGL
jgi:mycothiol synthase